MSNLNYSNLTEKDIVFIINSLRKSETDNYIKIGLLMDELIDRYYKNRNFNIYSLVKNLLSLTYHNVDYLEKIVKLLKDDVEKIENIDNDYIEDFFVCFLKIFEKEINENAYRSHYDLLLNNVEKLKLKKINNAVLRQKINVFVNNINDIKKNLEVDINVSSDVIQDNKDVEEKKVFKFLKSKVKHSDMRQIMKDFSLFSEEDRFSILQVIARKKWEDCLYQNQMYYYSEHIGNILKVLDENKTFFIEYVNDIPNLCPVNFIVQALNSHNCNIEIFYDYFNVSNFSDFINVIKNWYLTFNGTTEVGQKYFIRHLILSYRASMSLLYQKVNSPVSNDIVNEFVDLCCNDFKEINSILIKFKGSKLSELNTEIDIPYCYIEPSGILLEYRNSKFYEKIYNSHNMNLLYAVWGIFTFYNNRVFQNNCLISINDGNYYFNEKIQQVVEEFLELVKTFKVTKEDLWLKSLVRKYLEFYLYNNCFDKKLAKDIILNENLFNNFSSCFDNNYCKYGYPCGKNDDLYNIKVALFSTCYDTLDYNNEEDLKAVISIGITDDKYYNQIEFNGKKYDSIYDFILNGIQSLYPELYNIIKFYYGIVDDANNFIEKNFIISSTLLFINNYFCKEKTIH